MFFVFYARWPHRLTDKQQKKKKYRQFPVVDNSRIFDLLVCRFLYGGSKIWKEEKNDNFRKKGKKIKFV